jgi:death-on-curing protein
VTFLTAEDALAIHAFQLERFGGGSGVRSLDLLESAVAQAQASFGGEYLHTDVFEMAAAYLYHIVQNHPFVDGNKRAGLLCALVFLDLNGKTIGVADERLYEITVAVASGEAGKAQVATLLRGLAGEPTVPPTVAPQ